jgi:hypothetical protein
LSTLSTFAHFAPRRHGGSSFCREPADWPCAGPANLPGVRGASRLGCAAFLILARDQRQYVANFHQKQANAGDKVHDACQRGVAEKGFSARQHRRGWKSQSCPAIAWKSCWQETSTMSSINSRNPALPWAPHYFYYLIDVCIGTRLLAFRPSMSHLALLPPDSLRFGLQSCPAPSELALSSRLAPLPPRRASEPGTLFLPERVPFGHVFFGRLLEERGAPCESLHAAWLSGLVASYFSCIWSRHALRTRFSPPRFQLVRGLPGHPPFLSIHSRTSA